VNTQTDEIFLSEGKKNENKDFGIFLTQRWLIQPEQQKITQTVKIISDLYP